MGIARKIRNKSQWYQISRYPMDSSFKILEIWHPILLCLYLGSLISCRNVSVLQTELQIPPFKWDMSWSSSMFSAQYIIQPILETYLVAPCTVFIFGISCSNSTNNNVIFVGSFLCRVQYMYIVVSSILSPSIFLFFFIHSMTSFVVFIWQSVLLAYFLWALITYFCTLKQIYSFISSPSRDKRGL